MLLAITNICNLKCSYCFAGDMHLPKKMFMDVENIQKIMEWMVKNNDFVLKILGGEPTLHPQFEKIIKIVNTYVRRYHWELSILTNGSNLLKYFDIFLPGTKFLINYNYPKNANEEKLFAHTNTVLEEMYKIGAFKTSQTQTKYKACMSCNLYPQRTDYNFFWDIVDKYEIKNLRVSVTSPQELEYRKNRDLYFKTMKEIFMDFIRNTAKRNIKVFLDCSYIPPCYFDYQELYLIKSVSESNESYAKCELFGQVMPDMTYSVCFGSKDYNKKIDKFDKYKKELINNDEKNEMIKKHFMKKCESCELKKFSLCYSGCFGFEDEDSD